MSALFDILDLALAEEAAHALRLDRPALRVGGRTTVVSSRRPLPSRPLTPGFFRQFDDTATPKFRPRFEARPLDPAVPDPLRPLQRLGGAPKSGLELVIQPRRRPAVETFTPPGARDPFIVNLPQKPRRLTTEAARNLMELILRELRGVPFRPEFRL